MLLEQLNAFLTTSDQLKDRYSLDVTVDEVEAKNGKINAASMTPETSIGRMISKLRPTIYTTAGRIINASNGTFKRLRWATRDKDKLKRYPKETKAEYNLLIRGVLSMTSTAADVAQIIDLVDDRPSLSSEQQAIKSAAYFKQVRLLLGADRQEGETRPPSTREVHAQLPKLRKLKRSLKPCRESQQLRWMGLEFASYHGCQVLIQWKTAGAPDWNKYEEQIKSLAVLLMSIHDPSFRSLECFGYYPAESKDAHGIVYRVPDPSVSYELKTLRTLFKACSFVPLARRLEIALALAETMLQLHTAGWMHKNLRSDNVVFLAAHGSDAQTFVLSRPYVVGYEYARPDTWDAAQKYTSYLEFDLEEELYRHPQTCGADRQTYQKRFDMYALAAVLVELVAWKPLLDIQSTFTKPGLADEIARAGEDGNATSLPSLHDLFESKKCLAFLEHQAGSEVVGMIRSCSTMKSADDGGDASLETQASMVEKLSWCRI
ncbi:hypothetical protein IF1G_09232 [Cordyceps javanica]|uniref:Prion-inhibition and propagation HeLo domain-containing protein n=1 Tax=Cordyceps javanica TaxID=43265 RepID=A0A545URS8_9HYPO|nr:hypothetical protein IF1G_09232 [Cordyceps javanica]TQW04057.1 hypothetical protein IF2G_08371 [Cordyceps javanica]